MLSEKTINGFIIVNVKSNLPVNTNRTLNGKPVETDDPSEVSIFDSEEEAKVYVAEFDGVKIVEGSLVLSWWDE